ELQKISASFGKLWQVTLGGGEPFLRPDLHEICALYSKQNDTRVIVIPTNCLQPAATEKQVVKILEACPSTFLRLSLSLDGIGEDHDRNRGVPGNFKKFLETYWKLSALRSRFSNLNVDVSTTLSKLNENKIDQIIDYVEENLDPDNHDINFVRGRPKD